MVININKIICFLYLGINISQLISILTKQKDSCPNTVTKFNFAHLPGPHVDAGHLKAVMPRARVCALTLRTRADAVPVGLAILPATAVRATVVEVEPAAIHQYFVGDGSRASSCRGRRRVVGHLLLLAVHAWG